MSNIAKLEADTYALLLGNEAIARGALEGGMQFSAAYPGTPSSEIIGTLAAAAKEAGIYVEWSVNEKVAAEVAAAAAFSGLRGLVAMKGAGLDVALDFLVHVNLSTIGDKGGALLVIVCDDPQAHSSCEEIDTRWIAQFAGAPLVEPTDAQEAKDLTKWALELSAEFKCWCFLRSYTRLSHSHGNVKLGKISNPGKKAVFDTTKSYNAYLATMKHERLLDMMDRIQEVFETSPFNTCAGPEQPELLIICCGSGWACSLEAVEILGLSESVGILKLATLWPFPRRLVTKYLRQTTKVLVVEEVDPFIETHVRETAESYSGEVGQLEIYGKGSGHMASFGEITPDGVINALCKIFNLEYQAREAGYEQMAQDTAKPLVIDRGMVWCAGCPHRASFLNLRNAIRRDGRKAVVVGDIGCYTMDIFPYGPHQCNVVHGMGSGAGEACGFGKLASLGSEQPAIGICGDSTFFHASIPALINAVYNKSNMTLIVLDNGATAMTGFQPHPGTGQTATKEPAPVLSIEGICRAIGCRVEVRDPFDMKAATDTLCELMRDESGPRVLILRRKCELLRMRQETRHQYRVWVDPEKCGGEKCGYCYKTFQCPGLSHDKETDKVQIVEGICVGCGACVSVCPYKAIVKEEIR